jgi:hypothetical protein
MLDNIRNAADDQFHDIDTSWGAGQQSNPSPSADGTSRYGGIPCATHVAVARDVAALWPTGRSTYLWVGREKSKRCGAIRLGLARASRYADGRR